MKRIIVLAGIIFILDQLIKAIFITQINFGDTISLIPNFFAFTLVKNTGIAFSLFSGSQIPLIILTIIVLFIFSNWILKQQLTFWKQLSFGLLMGGILGNLIDRIFQGGVIDYLDFHIFEYDAPIFNLADIGVVIGTLLLMILIWKEDRTCKNTKQL